MRAADASSSIEPLGGVSVDAAATMGRQVVEQRIAHQRVAEAVAGARRLDDQRGERAIEVIERHVAPDTPDERDELVGVERGADDRDSLQHLTGGWLDAGDHVRVERLHPLGLGGRASGELVHRERDAAD